MASEARVERQLGSTYSSDGDRGINSANVENAKAKFQDYISTINAAFEEFKSNITKYEASFFGEQAAAIRGYVNNIMDASAAVLAELNQFAPQLDEAAAAYAAQDAGMSSSLSGTGTSA